MVIELVRSLLESSEYKNLNISITLSEKERYTSLGYLFPRVRNKYNVSKGLIIKNRRQFIKKTYKCEKVLAYDTETYEGCCKLIARNEGKTKFIYNPSFDDCLKFLFYNADNNNTYRFLFNLDFDIGSILKLWNDIKQITLLSKGITVIYKGFELIWYKSRLFSIKHIIRRKTVVFTDLNNFFHLKLDDIAKEYLKGKAKHDIDGNKLNTSLDYWNDNLQDIIKYCINDCVLTKEIGSILVKSIVECGLSLPKCLISSASLSKQYFRLNSFIPNISHIPLVIQRIGYNCYFGGRFEMFKKGSFNTLYLYDIVSQYPSFIKNLPNLRDGVWKRMRDIPKEQCLGYFLVKLQIPFDYKIPTIPIHHKGINKFPVGSICKWITWFDVDLMREFIVKVIRGYVFYPTDKNYKPFENQINTLFEKKQEYKGKQKLKYNLVKLCMNALYGCFVEVHKNYINAKEYELNGGVLFNSVYASQITAFGRWSVIKDIPKSKYDNIIAIHTDSLISNISLNKYLSIGKNLGQWNLEKKGKGVIINTGMYQIDDLVKTRGIPVKYIKDWFLWLEKNKKRKKKQFNITHMRKLSEGLVRDKSLINVNTILQEKKSVNCNSDVKRVWLDEYSHFNEVLVKNIDSFPLILYNYDLNHQIPDLVNRLRDKFFLGQT